jgi:hypothetical protein
MCTTSLQSNRDYLVVIAGFVVVDGDDEAGRVDTTQTG